MAHSYKNKKTTGKKKNSKIAIKRTKTKPQKRISKKKTNKKQSSSSLIKKIFKFSLIAFIWGIIAVIIAVIYLAHDLPNTENITKIPNKAAITVIAYNGEVIGRAGNISGEKIDINELPNYIADALVATEDRRFYSHFGIDIFGLIRAIFNNISSGKFKQGGSTITQQLAKNLFLSADKTIKRKTQEALLAIWLEKKLTKDEIISAYLNRVYFGAGAYGIDAAAKTYFNKSAYELSLPESTMLIGLLKAPSKYSPFSNPKLAIKRTKTVITAMNEAGFLSNLQAKAISKQSITINIVRQNIANKNRYFVDWVVNNIGSFITANEGNLIIETTFDPYLQNIANHHIKMGIQNIKTLSKPQAAFIAMSKNGAIRAMVGGIDYKISSFNRAVQAKRQPGSTFKPFVYLTALMQGWQPYDKILDAPINSGKYRPQNFADKYLGQVTLKTALSQSLNTATFRLAKQVGLDNIINIAKKAGISSKLRRDMSLILGSSEVSLLELTSAYGIFANLGYEIYPFAITKIINNKGNILYQHEYGNIKRIFPENAVQKLDDMLTQTVENGTARQAKINGVKIRGKTGTSQNSRDAWFIGYSDNIVAGIWLGYDDNKEMQNITGGKLPAHIWQNIISNFEQ